MCRYNIVQLIQSQSKKKIMDQPSGLIGCTSNWSTAFCVTKTIQSIISLCLIIWIIIEMVNYYHYVRVIKSSFILIVEILMILTLTFNIAFALYHKIFALLYLEIYFTNMYFVVLCYYLIYNVFKRIKWMRMLIAGFVGFLSLVFLLILIDSFIKNLQGCKQLPYLVTYSVGLFACILMFAAYRYNQVKEKQRIQKFNKMLQSDQIDLKDVSEEKFLKIKTPSKVNFNTPFKNIWLLIVCNVLCRIIGLAQSLSFEFDWSQNQTSNCLISENPTVNSILNFIFALFTMYLGFVATIWVFRQKRKAKDEFHNRVKSPSDFSNVDSNKNMLQMVAKNNFSMFYQKQASNLSDLYEKKETNSQKRKWEYQQQ